MRTILAFVGLVTLAAVPLYGQNKEQERLGETEGRSPGNPQRSRGYPQGPA
jgi:hypothetical protein